MAEYIRKAYYQELVSALSGDVNLLQVIVGPRQVGKTTLALQVTKRWPGPTLYETADRPGTPTLGWLEEAWQKARRLTVKNTPALLVVDEIQKIPNWSDLVKKLFDEDKRYKRNMRVVLLGSSSLLMQKGLAESLAGRFELHRHYQWSYGECNKAFGLTLPEFLYFGGYPGGLAFRNDPERWARYIRDSLIETVLAKDILLLSPISKPALLRQTFQLATSFPAQILSYQKMLGTLTDTGNVTTIASYLKLLASAFLVLPLERFSGTVVKQRGSSPKIIMFDNALVSVMNNLSANEVKSDSAWQGRLIENAVGAKIWTAIEKQGGELLYWRERDKEVDFVVRIGKKLQAIEVKSGQTEIAVPGLDYFLHKFQGSRGLVVAAKPDDYHFPNTNCVTIEDFLLEPEKWLLG